MGEPLVLASLNAPDDADTPAARRAWLTELPADELTAQVAHMATALRTIDSANAERLAAVAGLPVGEVLASPFALRAVALAVEQGAGAMHHDSRAMLQWHETMLADESVVSEQHGTWEAGVLHAGKYEAFLQDEPLSTFNPNYMSKWGPHELLHRACRYFWRDGMTRWELYLGARLNELVPVVDWYGPDEVLRLDRVGFVRARDAASPRAGLDRAQWLSQSPDALEQSARETCPFLIDGLEHFAAEWEAIDQEIAHGVRVPVAHEVLNASSDATAYVVGHFVRLTSEPFTWVQNNLMRFIGVFDSTIASYRDHIESCFDRLLFGDLRLDLSLCEARQTGRLVQDAFLRAALSGETHTRAIEDLASKGVDQIRDAQRGEPVDLASWASEFDDRLPGEDSKRIWYLGGPPAAPHLVDIEQLLDGLDSCVPASLMLIAALDLADALVLDFLRSTAFRSRGSLPDRLVEFLGGRGLPLALTEMVRFEAIINRVQRLADDQVEHLTPPVESIPDDWQTGQAGRSGAFRMVDLEADVAPLHSDLMADVAKVVLPAARPTTYLVGGYRGGVSVLPAPPPVVELWAALGEGSMPVESVLSTLDSASEGFETTSAESGEWPDSAEGWVLELLTAGALCWAPNLG